MKVINNNEFDLLFLVGQDNLKINKNNEFIIYLGSHGDRGAEIADVVLPGAAYTEQDGHFTNLEGKIQKAYKASYPPGDSKEDWLVFNELSLLLKRKKLFKDKEELLDNMMNFLKLNKRNDFKKFNKTEFIDEKFLPYGEDGFRQIDSSSPFIPQSFLRQENWEGWPTMG